VVVAWLFEVKPCVKTDISKSRDSSWELARTDSPEKRWATTLWIFQSPSPLISSSQLPTVALTTQCCT